MIEKIELFLFALSIFFNIDIIVRGVRNALKTPPVPLVLDWQERLLWGISLSYIITYILI
jgi:hypothetical protein